MESTNIGSSANSLQMCDAPDGGSLGFSLAPGDVLMSPGKPEPYSGVFHVRCGQPVGIRAWGLTDNDTLVVEQVKQTSGTMPKRIKCCTVPGSKGQVALVSPLLHNCEPVTLSACNDYIILDRPGQYRLGWAIKDGCQPTAFGEILVEKVAECSPVDPARRGYGNSQADMMLAILQILKSQQC